MSSRLCVTAARTCLRRTAPFLRTHPYGLPQVAVTGLQSRSQASLAAAPAAAGQPASDPLFHADAAAAPKANKAEAVEEKGTEVPFSSLRGIISPETLMAITEKPHQFVNMSPVQAAVLPLLPQISVPHDPEAKDAPPRDMLVRAKTGTGKTLAFLVPTIEARIKDLERFGRESVAQQGLVSSKTMESQFQRRFAREHAGTLIISPTRELATQIANDALKLSTHHKDFSVRLFTGGANKRHQIRDWNKGRRDIVVGTPGRLRDVLISEPTVAHGLKNCKRVILDEADTLLEMGFRDDLDAILSHVAKTPERQTMLFSATVSRAIKQVAQASMDRKHIFLDCVSDDDSPVHEHVPQYHTVLPSAEEQIPHLMRLLAHDQLSNPSLSKAIVFLPTTKMTQLFATLMREMRSSLPGGLQTKVYEMHSGLSQDQRTRTSDRFRKESQNASVLVTSDVSARGVDYPNVTRVIQVGIPGSREQYIHRVGRTGRGGTKQGRGDLVLLPWEMGFVTWQLTDVKMRPLTTNQLKEQVETLAAEKQEAYTAVHADMPGKLRDLLEQVDEEAVSETFASLLGYYIAKVAELRVRKDVMLQGIRDWTTQGLGLPQAPYLSDSFLTRLGFNDGRTLRFGRANTSYQGDRGKRTTSWSGRGQQSTRDNKDTGYGRNDHRLSPRDPRGLPEDYRGQRMAGP